jgi:hypothetical protein
MTQTPPRLGAGLIKGGCGRGRRWAPPAQLYTVRHSKYAADAHALFCEGLWQTPRMVAAGGGQGTPGEEAAAAVVDLGSAPHVLGWYHRWLLSSGLVGTSKRGIIVGQVGVPLAASALTNPRHHMPITPSCVGWIREVVRTKTLGIAPANTPLFRPANVCPSST